mgnify:CR=1 FL=1
MQGCLNTLTASAAKSADDPGSAKCLRAHRWRTVCGQPQSFFLGQVILWNTKHHVLELAVVFEVALLLVLAVGVVAVPDGLADGGLALCAVAPLLAGQWNSKGPSGIPNRGKGVFPGGGVI